jgi:putative heme-binding domain-containing protein
LTSAYPDLVKKLGGADGVDMEAWRKRLAAIDWDAGDSNRGKAVFARANCAACHSGSQAMGPDLSGVAGRFSRDDLFTAILQPSKDISPRYRTTQIETSDGRTYQGLIVYEAVDGLILQTGPAETVRLPGSKIESKRLTAISMMPPGLLDRLADSEIADLYSFLKSLSKRP